jgi:hypothetical protein
VFVPLKATITGSADAYRFGIYSEFAYDNETDNPFEHRSADRWCASGAARDTEGREGAPCATRAARSGLLRRRAIPQIAKSRRGTGDILSV